MARPQYGVAFTFDVALIDSASRPDIKTTPTLASGDVQISKDGGSLANITTLPSESPASSGIIQVALSATEMQAERIAVKFLDVAGAEWDDLLITINTEGDIDVDGTVSDAGPVAGDFDGDTGLSASDDFYNTSMLVFTSGSLKGIARVISDYVGSSRNIQFNGSTGAADAPFPTAPANGDRFKILGIVGT